MRIAVLTMGSRGDVQPYVALSRGLRAAGHEAWLATAERFRDFVESHEVPFRTFEALDPHEVLFGAEGSALVEGGGNALEQLRAASKLLEPAVEKGFAEAARVCADADAVVTSSLALLFSDPVCERLRLPQVPALLQPVRTTAEFPSWMFPPAPRWLPGRRAWHRISHRLTWDLMWWLFRRPNQKARARVLGLPPGGSPIHRIARARELVLHGWSPSVLPRPPEWGAEVRVTGYWFLDAAEGFAPPPELEAFLADGPPPVCVGFGSMPSQDPARLTETVVRALERCGQRGLLLTGWGGLGGISLPPQVLAVDALPHDWLFPRVAAVVHHGGLGTTGAAFRAGVPQVALPFFGDQPFWAARVPALGVGPRPIRRRALSVERLAQAMHRAVADAEHRRRAAAVAERIRAEDGVGSAVAALPF
jgi:UDP:flavonoid glycosyltransferase YjiC (YdhE family)